MGSTRRHMVPFWVTGGVDRDERSGCVEKQQIVEIRWAAGHFLLLMNIILNRGLIQSLIKILTRLSSRRISACLNHRDEPHSILHH